MDRNEFHGPMQRPLRPPVLNTCSSRYLVPLRGEGSENVRMREVYKQEVPHFLSAINPHSDDPRFKVPKEMVHELAECLIDDMERAERDGEAWW